MFRPGVESGKGSMKVRVYFVMNSDPMGHTSRCEIVEVDAMPEAIEAALPRALAAGADVANCDVIRAERVNF